MDVRGDYIANEEEEEEEGEQGGEGVEGSSLETGRN